MKPEPATFNGAHASAFEIYDPQPGGPDAPPPPVMAVNLAAWRRDAAERELAEAVRAPAINGCHGARSARRSAPAVRPLAAVRRERVAR